MKFSIKALVNAAALVGGISVFVVGILNMIWPTYALSFLEMLESIYPGYKANGSFGNVIIATLYATIDSALCAAIFGWIYNRYVRDEDDIEE